MEYGGDGDDGDGDDGDSTSWWRISDYGGSCKVHGFSLSSSL